MPQSQDSPADDALTTRKREDPLSFSSIAGGVVILVFVCLACPPLILFVPFAIVGMVVLFLLSGKTQSQARKLAAKHLQSAQGSGLQVEFSPGLTSSLVMNDWGLVFTSPNQRPIEMSWNDVTLVEEPQVALLVFHSNKGRAFETDLSQERYFLATRSIYSKIPDKTDLQVDPKTGSTNLRRRMEHATYEWRGGWGFLTMSREAVEHSKGGRIVWDDIQAVEEHEYEGEEAPTHWQLEFRSARASFVLERRHFDDGRQIGYSGYDMIKAIAEQRIPNKVEYTYRSSMPSVLAEREFDRESEVTKVAMSLALKSGKWSAIEERFRHMEWLVDTFKLDRVCDTRTFFLDYCELMSRTTRCAEAQRFLARANGSANGSATRDSMGHSS